MGWGFSYNRFYKAYFYKSLPGFLRATRWGCLIMTYLFYLLMIAPTIFVYLYIKRRKEHRMHSLQRQNNAEGLNQPASLHPLIDGLNCIGCGSCVAACPERNVIGLLSGKAELVTAANCVGHGACEKACPVGAISLVFGTAERGIDIPVLDKNFQSAVPGIYIAGELGGMGLVRNAIEQGRQAVMHISKSIDQAACETDAIELLIVGAGPAGIAAALAAKEQGVDYLLIEQESLGGSVFHFPRAKIVMTAPVKLPLVGEMTFRETTKEALLLFWEKVCASHELRMHFKERFIELRENGSGFAVVTNRSQYNVKKVLLCLGRRGSPRKLGVAGEDLPHVVYSLADASQYTAKRVLVVGGGDSALEAAIALSEQGAEQVCLAYRGSSFSRAKPANRQRMQQCVERNEICLMMCVTPKLIASDHVLLQDSNSHETRLAIDAVIICAGGILPTAMLEKMGIKVETKYGSV